MNSGKEGVNQHTVSEQETRKVLSHIVSLYKVFGGDLVRMGAERGLPEVRKLIAEQKAWDWGLSNFDWDDRRKAQAERPRVPVCPLQAYARRGYREARA